MTVYLNGDNLTIDDVVRVARGGEKAEFTPEAKERIERCSQMVERLVERGLAIYGVTTGIGELARVRISPEMGQELQKRIIYSHSAGYGEPFPIEVVRGAMLLRAQTLARGHSGVRLSTAQMLLDMLNLGITPVVYQKGSLGVSGDLSPMSQIAEVVIGEGEAFFQGERLPGGKALARVGLKPVQLTFKEGLGLINGSQMSLSGASLALVDARNLLKNALIAYAFTIDVLKGVISAYDYRLHRTRPFNGQNVVAYHLRKLMSDSEILAQGSSKVQDGYSMRCTPQVVGPSVDAWLYACDQVEKEINSTADNPIFIPEEELYLAGGNFHSQNIALVMDFLGMAMSEVANLAERHINRLLNPVLSGLPDFLVEGQGLNSGLMVAQYTAAALVSENKVLSHPAVVDSIPVSADQEDHVAMTPIAVHKCREIISNGIGVIAIALLCAAQGADFRQPLRPGRGGRIAHRLIREKVPFLKNDRILHPDIAQVAQLVREGTIVKKVEEELGEITFIWDRALQEC